MSHFYKWYDYFIMVILLFCFNVILDDDDGDYYYYLFTFLLFFNCFNDGDRLLTDLTNQWIFFFLLLLFLNRFIKTKCLNEPIY